MALQSDALLLTMLKATGAQRVYIGDAQVWAIFDNGYFEVTDTPGVETRQPFLTCRTSDLSELQKDSTVEIGSESYRVRRHEPDGTGMSRVLLKR